MIVRICGSTIAITVLNHHSGPGGGYCRGDLCVLELKLSVALNLLVKQHMDVTFEYIP